jgi:hypothetical protein
MKTHGCALFRAGTLLPVGLAGVPVRTSGIVVLCLGLTACAGGSGTGSPGATSANPTAPSTVPSQSQPTSATDPVYVDYQGRWTGNVLVTACSANLDIASAGLCAEFPVGTWLPLSVFLQGASTSFAVAGTLTLGSLQRLVPDGTNNGGVTGVIASDQSLTMSGSIQGQGTNWGWYQGTIPSWYATLNGNGDRMLVTFSMDLRQADLAGDGVVTVTAPGLTLISRLP